MAPIDARLRELEALDVKTYSDTVGRALLAEQAATRLETRLETLTKFVEAERAKRTEGFGALQESAGSFFTEMREQAEANLALLHWAFRVTNRGILTRLAQGWAPLVLTEPPVDQHILLNQIRRASAYTEQVQRGARGTTARVEGAIAEYRNEAEALFRAIPPDQRPSIDPIDFHDWFVPCHVANRLSEFLASNARDGIADQERYYLDRFSEQLEAPKTR